jgi:tetratricopeptide (TPR) repeat protein
MATLKEYENQVKSLMIEEKWAEAYKICNKILSYDPENTTFIKYRNRIEKEVRNVNKRAITNELLRLEKLIKEKNFEQYLREIAPLQTYVTDFPEIGEKIVHAKKMLDKQYKEKRDRAFQEIADEIKQKGDSVDYETTLQKLENLYKLDIRQNEVLALEKKVKKSYIKQQIELNKGLIESNRFEDIIIFLLKLKKLDPQNAQVNSVINRIKNIYQRYKIENKQDFIFKTVEEIKTLYITKKYELCMELCERVIEIDPTNSMANKYYKSASRRANSQSIKKIDEDIYYDYKQFPKSSFYKNKDFIRI